MFKRSVHTLAHMSLAALLVVALAFGAWGTQTARAASLVVNTTADNPIPGDGFCTLREAINNANTDSDTTSGDCLAGSGADTITFSFSEIIRLHATLNINDADGLTIDGSGQNITISGNGQVQVMQVSAGAILNINALRITGGFADGLIGGSRFKGGGIYNEGTLTVTDSTVFANAAPYGGGILNDRGTLTVRNSTFSGNHARDDGGGIANEGGVGTVVNSTFTDNNADFGGGILNFQSTLSVTGSTFTRNIADIAGGGIANIGTLTITNSTFSDNRAPSGAGGGIYSSIVVPPTTLRNTIVANSSSGGNCSGSITDGGGNLVWGDTTCPGINADPQLLALADNGGPTQTMALDTGSAAIDAAIAEHCPAKDQRGVSRPQGAGCDIGAFELEPVQDITPPTITITTPADGAGYLLGEVVSADYSCADETGGSGIASCDGTVANGSPIDTSTVGPKSFTVDAEDNAGNPQTLTHNYNVVYSFSDFFSPVDKAPTLNIAKAGQTIALKWRITDASGNPVTNLTSVSAKVENLSCSVGSSADQLEEYASGSSGLQNLGDGYYQWNWKTPKSYANSCKTLKLDLGEGAGYEHIALFQFKK